MTQTVRDGRDTVVLLFFFFGSTSSLTVYDTVSVLARSGVIAGQTNTMRITVS